MVSQATADEVFSRIFQDPSNTSCVDCGSPEVKHASVNHGIFICDHCALAHQSLGRSISFLKSLQDTWSIRHLKLLTVGGNQTLTNFFTTYNMPPDATVQFKYCTLAAKYYREMLKVMAEGETCSMQSPTQQEGLTLIMTCPVPVPVPPSAHEEKKPEEAKSGMGSYFSSALSKTYGLGRNLVGKVMESERVKGIEHMALETAHKVGAGLVRGAQKGMESLAPGSEMRRKSANFLKTEALHAYDAMTRTAFTTYHNVSTDERTKRMKEDSMAFLINLEKSIMSHNSEEPQSTAERRP